MSNRDARDAGHAGGTAEVDGDQPAGGLDRAELAGRLDHDHLPETNGRMAVCRRCGGLTDGPEGVHRPAPRQVDRLAAWLDRQRHLAGTRREDRRIDT